MNEKQKYASEWCNSAEYFLEHKNYANLAIQIKEYDTVLEIGCGTGHSTLALLEAGHRVIAVDQNPCCIELAKKLIEEAGYTINESANDLASNSVCFYECDITEPIFKDKILNNLTIDVVICWNIGTYWDKEKLENSIPKMLTYGLTIEQIYENIESSYGELVLWHACNIAKIKGCTVHIVDRSLMSLNCFNDTYYKALKNEFGFKEIKYSNLKATTLSQGGRKLVTNGQVHESNELSIIFISILMK